MKSSNSKPRVFVPVNEITFVEEADNIVTFGEMKYNVVNQQFVVFTSQLVGGKILETESRINKMEIPDDFDNLSEENPSIEFKVKIPNPNGTTRQQSGMVSLISINPEVYSIIVGKKHTIVRRHSNGWPLALVAGAVVIGAGLTAYAIHEGYDIDIDISFYEGVSIEYKKSDETSSGN